MALRMASRIAALFPRALNTWLRPKRGGVPHTTALQAERERLIDALREARRKHRSTSDIAARLRAVTTEILRSESDA
ncbi:hypothetical protein [Pseudogemmobacter sonorensis]|uniref:hypothetical protein n=1 Tax=Pseudogemmobacter sonorensis TaxID=2989681 RepID=UPI003F67FBC4